MIDVVRSLLTGLLSPAGPPQACVAHAQALGVPWLIRQGLAPLTWHTLRALPAQSVPADLSAELRAAYLAAVGDAELHQHELELVLEALSVQNVRPVVLKGAALAYTVYPVPASGTSPWLRI